MNKYEVVMEGREGDNGYFILFTVVCDEKDIESLCTNKVSELNLQIVGIDEILLIESNVNQMESKVLDVSGRSYFDLP